MVTVKNPLFVDSTKFRGEMIIADLEIQGVNLLEGETLHTKVTLKDGRSYLVKLDPQPRLNPSQPISYKGSLRLAYQEEVSFQHIVMQSEKIVIKTEAEKLPVNYINRFTPKQITADQRAFYPPVSESFLEKKI